MPLACGLIGKPCQLVRRKLWMTYPSQGAPMHLVQRCFIDDIVRVSGAQRIEEVNPPAPRRRKQNLKPGLGSCPYYQYSGNPAYSPACETHRRSSTFRLFAGCKFRGYGSLARLLKERSGREDEEDGVWEGAARIAGWSAC